MIIANQTPFDMKTLTTIMILLISGLAAFTQVTLNGSYNLEPGDTYRNDTYDGVTGINPGPAGAGVSWDFGTIPNGTFIEGIPALCVEPAGTLFADSSAVSGANLCTKNSEGSDGPYVYYSMSGTGQTLLGLGYYESGNTSFTNYTDQLTAIEFPFAYGDEFSDTYEYLMWNVSAGGYFMRDSGSVHVEADAWGSIVTPEGSWDNVLRVTTTTVSYMWMDFGTGWVFTGIFTDVSHNWYAQGIKIPVMSISNFDDFPEYVVVYLAEHNFPVGIPEPEMNDLMIYPNPATGMVWIRSEQELRSVRIFSMDGRSLKEHYQHSAGHEMKGIPLQGMKPGLYLIEAKLKSGRFITDRLAVR